MTTVNAPGSFWHGAEIIHEYSRAQAIEDGVLVDLTEWASASHGFLGGFTCPVAVTAAVWAMIAPAKLPRSQDVRGRAHDVLFMASLTFRKLIALNARSSSPQATVSLSGLFSAYLQVGRTKKQTFKLIAGPGDDGELTITVLLPSED